VIVDDQLRVVFAVNTADGAELRAARNLLDAAEEPVQLELVCFGAGLDIALAGGTHAEPLRELMARGVTVHACRNTLHGRGLDAAALADGVGVVPAAVLHLARRQRAGWSYLTL
jgi:intracellular sulfur oxidation DsrE/DsrF family protein